MPLAFLDGLVKAESDIAVFEVGLTMGEALFPSSQITKKIYFFALSIFGEIT